MFRGTCATGLPLCHITLPSRDRIFEQPSSCSRRLEPWDTYNAPAREISEKQALVLEVTQKCPSLEALPETSSIITESAIVLVTEEEFPTLFQGHQSRYPKWIHQPQKRLSDYIP